MTPWRDSAPLHRMILRLLDDKVVEAIAAEYRKGRLLLVMTTNLDAGRPVIWNIGAIASSGHPRARELIARVLLASASIPGAFPPVLLDVQLDGQGYQEMHVDGGAIAQSFLYPPALAARSVPNASAPPMSFATAGSPFHGSKSNGKRWRSPAARYRH